MVGTCGYSYKDWVGRFYPDRIKPNAMLAFYAEHFPAVEIDATYYRIPPAATFASMAERTPEHFRFTVKVPGTLTHLPVDDVAGGVSDDARYFRENLEPLREQKKLAAVLAQFPYSFEPAARTEAYLRALREALAELPFVCEFRNREWQRPSTLALLGELGAGWCNVDEPQFERLLHPSNDVVGKVGYVRFHGRNYKQWWNHQDAAERYDYAYTSEELAPWAARVAEMAVETQETFAFFNNHRFGKAAQSADLFAGLLAG